MEFRRVLFRSQQHLDPHRDRAERWNLRERIDLPAVDEQVSIDPQLTRLRTRLRIENARSPAVRNRHDTGTTASEDHNRQFDRTGRRTDPRPLAILQVE